MNDSWLGRFEGTFPPSLPGLKNFGPLKKHGVKIPLHHAPGAFNPMNSHVEAFRGGASWLWVSFQPAGRTSSGNEVTQGGALS